jgi:hypothetical protein
MPRIRTIKPDFFSNEQIGQLPAEARLLFIGLWTLADREGRLQDRPIRIGAQLFPYDAAWSVASFLEDLAKANLIWRYEVEGKKCIQIINFTKHQNPHPKETTFGLPAPPKQCREITGNSAACRVGSHVLTMYSLTMDYGALSPTPLPAEEGGTNPPEETKSARKTSERASRSKFSLKECEQYAASLKRIKTPKAFAKIIWRSGEDDAEIAEFQARGDSGHAVKKPPDKPVDVAELQRLADDLDAMKHHEAADALRASIQASAK